MFDGKEGSDFGAARTDDADDGGGDEDDVVVGSGKEDSRESHEDRADEERAFASAVVGVSSQPERDARVTEKGEGEEQADGLLIVAEGGEVEEEGDGKEAVCKEANDARGAKISHALFMAVDCRTF